MITPEQDEHGQRLHLWQQHEERLAQAKRARRLLQRRAPWGQIGFLFAALLTFGWIVGWMIYSMFSTAIHYAD